jgi:glycosyltransferase involved in cell wall biosynthesis
MSDELRIGVPGHLLALAPAGGHGKVWSRVLAQLRGSATIVELGARSRRDGRYRRPVRRRRSEVDVILCSGHEQLPDPVAPVVAQVHEAGWFDPELRGVLDPGFLARIAPLTERAARTATQLITPSNRARADLIAAYGLPADRVHAVHHGLDPGFRPGLPGGAELVARAGGAAGAPYVLYAATLHPRKNLGALRDAMASLAADGRPHVLAVAGGPAPDRDDSTALLRAAAAELPGAPGRVAILGEPSDAQLAALMAGAAAFCLPSLYEGFGLTALEAMACGAPVVVSDRGALPEVVGGAGVVVAPTAAGVRGGLARVLGDPVLAARLGAAGAARARGFSWEAAGAGWLSVLRHAAGALP